MAHRAWIAVTGAFFAGLVLPSVPAAAGGGGCHTGVTQGSGTTVEMVDACFTPTVLYAEPGAEVVFVNRSDMTHNVTANQWGHFEDIARGGAFRAAFDAPGVYPFACSIHPGMSGAVVVGNGSGGGSGESVTVTVVPYVPGEGGTEGSETVGSATEPQLAQQPEPADAGSALGWVAGGVIGLGAGIGVGLAAGRRRRTIPGMPVGGARG